MRARIAKLIRTEVVTTNLILAGVMALVIGLMMLGCNGQIEEGVGGAYPRPAHKPASGGADSNSVDPGAEVGGTQDGGPAVGQDGSATGSRPPGQTVGTGPGDPPPAPPPPGPPTPGSDAGAPFVPTDPGMCSGVSYLGFDGTPLETDRDPGDPSQDRGRIKPYEVLAAEYKRVLGKTPALVGQQSSTFGADPPRWFTEPTTSAVTLFGAYRIAFQGCLTLTAMPATFASEPTDATAATQCAAWAERFWSRSASDDEVAACVSTAVTDTASEPDPRRRWAYTCAAVLTSAGFLTY